MSEKLIIFILLVVFLARPKQPDEIQISGEMKLGCFYLSFRDPPLILSGEVIQGKEIYGPSGTNMSLPDVMGKCTYICRHQKAYVHVIVYELVQS